MSAASDPVRVAVLGNSFARAIQLPALRWASAHGAPNRVVSIAGRDADKARATAALRKGPFAIDGDEARALEAAARGHPGACATEADSAVPPSVDPGKAQVPPHSELWGAVLQRSPGPRRVVLRDSLLWCLLLALIDHQTRWSRWRRAFAARVKQGICGAPWAARLQMRLGSVPRIDRGYSWWYDADRGGGCLGALGSHVIDGVLDQFGERVARVAANLLTLVPEREGPGGAPVPVTADDAANLWCELESGLPLQIETGVLDFGCERDAGAGVLIELKGEEGTLRLEGEILLTFTPHGGAAEEIPVDPLPTHAELGVMDAGMFPRCLPGYLADVVRAVRDGERQVPGAATFADGVHVMDVLDAARASWAERRWVGVRDVAPGA